MKMPYLFSDVELLYVQHDKVGLFFHVEFYSHLTYIYMRGGYIYVCVVMLPSVECARTGKKVGAGTRTGAHW